MAGADSNENGDEFPAVCSDCIGPDKHIKMIRQPQGNECRICTRPFTVFIWNPSDNVRKSKKTIICSTCSRARNCCQSCMRDINFRIPLEIRDTALKMAGLDKAYSFTSKSLESTNREVKAIMADKQEAKFNQDSEQDQQEQAREILTKLSERLTERSVKPKSDRSSEKKHEDIKGVDISKILSKLPFAGSIEIPEDKTITSFFVFGLTDDFPQWAITNYCNQFGKLRNMTIIHRAKCGYVGFITRDAAESFSKAIIANGLNENKATPGVLVLENRFPIRVSWGKPRSLGTTNPEQYKIGLVVQKVMRQLAEKDKDHLTGKSSQPNKSLKKKQPSKIKPLEKQADKRQLDKPKYKALSEDFEI